jgi:hypothetical protein
MSDTGNDMERLAPQKLLEPFAKGKVIRFVILAVVIHVVVIGAFSTRYVYYNWIDREAGKALKEAEALEVAERKAGPATAAPIATNRAAAPAAPKGSAPQTTGTSDKELVEKHGDKPVVKAITEAASPDEIPKAPTPDGLGISLEDTN